MDDIAHLQSLRTLLKARGWIAETRSDGGRTVLLVKNPAAERLNDRISVSGEVYRWGHGTEIGPVNEVSAVADRILHVLRVSDQDAQR